jgi:hypothetical protein
VQSIIRVCGQRIYNLRKSILRLSGKFQQAEKEWWIRAAGSHQLLTSFKVKEQIDQNSRGNRRVSISYEFQSWTKALQEWTKAKRKTFCSSKMRKPSDGPNAVITDGIFITSNSRIHIQTHRLRRGIYEVSRWDWYRCRDIHTKFHKDWISHSKVPRRGYTDTQTHRQYGDRISLRLFFQNQESRLKMCDICNCCVITLRNNIRKGNSLFWNMPCINLSLYHHSTKMCGPVNAEIHAFWSACSWVFSFMLRSLYPWYISA